MSSASSMIFQREKPSGKLSHVIDEYTYRAITFHEKDSIRKEMPCRHINSIDFFLAGQYTTTDVQSKQNVPFARTTIRGPRTCRKYSITIEQDFVCFSIRFKPTGIYELLGIPMSEFSNRAIDATDVFPGLFKTLTEKLLGATDLFSCIAIVEPLLLKQLRNYYTVSSYTSKLAAYIVNENTNVRLTSLYKDIPFSSRHIERSFIKEVGITPKMYSDVVRFSKVLQTKKDHPREKWSSLAYDHHYFDQMHLIKDFKRFLGINPGQFRLSEFAL